MQQEHNIHDRVAWHLAFLCNECIGGHQEAADLELVLSPKTCFAALPIQQRVRVLALQQLLALWFCLGCHQWHWLVAQGGTIGW